ncbi:MAG: NosD domain-containing protein, partial [Methanothrix sp.]|nr:NosD domain-containing protein [Methanothrix sp.]
MRKPPLCILCAVVLIAHAGASTVQVSHDLQAAIDAASPGDTLLVAPGVYDRITVTKSLSIIGNGSVIRAGSRDACVSIGADGVTFSGFLVRDGFYGIKLDGVRGCRIANNTVVHCTQPGIALLYSDENTIIGNNASFNGLGGEGWYGIYLSNSNDNVIAENVAFGNGAYGINLFPSCSNNTIRDNVLQGNMYGLYMFTDCSDNLIENNDISQNTNSGLDLRFNCTGNQILNNTIQGNVVAGITLMDSGRNTIAGNDITGNRRYGLQVQGRSDENLIFHNIISESQTGIFVESSGNRIYGNRILDNILQSEDRGRNTWYAPYPEGGNLWSDYLGSDEMSGEDQDLPGSDGFGDEPYIIGERSRDIYPVMGGQVQPVSYTHLR